MKTLLSSLKLPALVSTLLVLPFLVLELSLSTDNRAPAAKYALDMAVLFGVLWLLPLAFMAGLLPIVRGLRAGQAVMQHPGRLLVRVGLLALVACVWSAILVDQLPCFLGLPNSD
jgi:hypothetical protein